MDQASLAAEPASVLAVQQHALEMAGI